MFIVIQTLQVFLAKESIIDTFEDSEAYSIIDTLEVEEYDNFKNEPRSLEIVKTFYKELNENIDDKYLYVFQQPIEVENIIDDIYLVGYEEGSSDVHKNHDGPYPIKTVQLNEKALNSFPLQIVDGQSFVSRDFQYQENGEIPILLGSDYSQYFNVGDSLKGSYIFIEFNFIIKGFLDQNAFVEDLGYPEVNLERSIVMPAIEFDDPKSSEDEEFQFRHYMQLINGAIYSTSDKESVNRQLENAMKISGFSHAVILGDSSTTLGKYFDALAQHKNGLIFFAVVLFLFCIGVSSIFMTKKMKESSKNVIIHLISGGTLHQISRIIYGEVIILILIPTVIVTLAVLLFMPYLPLLYPMTIFMTGFIVIFFAIIPIYIVIRRTPVSEWLKRGEE
jgi:hypothetical protein